MRKIAEVLIVNPDLYYTVEHPTWINLAAACKTALEQQEVKDGLKQAKEANLIL